MAALEQQLFANGLPVEALMEKAALALTAALRRDWGDQLARAGAVVLVGPGHNGGDGLVIARELHLAGLAVAIWSPFERHKPLTAAHLRHARWLGIEVLPIPPDPAGPALWIDALFGIGQSRPLSEPLAELLRQRQTLQPGGLVAIDVPSG
ncbi:MAG: NAD(P)H-hydrate epimerase, partial [Cyanobacteriota bacterium]|nr:NAD(P)H-hydrate epimerase [Cyanobacteriota bacterium]